MRLDPAMVDELKTFQVDDLLGEKKKEVNQINFCRLENKFKDFLTKIGGSLHICNFFVAG